MSARSLAARGLQRILAAAPPECFHIFLADPVATVELRQALPNGYFFVPGEDLDPGSPSLDFARRFGELGQVLFRPSLDPAKDFFCILIHDANIAHFVRRCHASAANLVSKGG